MIINKITLKNFYRYGNKEQTLDLTGTGITGIVGLNGYGKSTSVIDSLLFALYGKYRCSSVDGVVNRYIGKNCKVGVEFEQDGENYKIIRYRKHETHNNNIYIFKGDKDISGHTASETNSIILDIIKMPYIAFINSCVFSSELYSAFLATKNSDRLVVFENILSLKEINAFYVEIKKIIKEYNDKINEIVLNKQGVSSEIFAIEETINTYSTEAKRKLLEMKSRKENLKKEIKNTKSKIEELSIINIDEEKKKIGNISLKEEFEKRIELLSKNKKELDIEIPKDVISIYLKYKDVDFVENKLKEEKYKEDLETLKARENGYTNENLNIDNLNRQIINLEKEKDGSLEKEKEAYKKLESLNNSLCPFCGQHLNSDRTNEEIEKANKLIELSKSSNEEIEGEINNLKEQLKEAQENYAYLLNDYNKIKQNLNNDFVPNSDLAEEQFKNASQKMNEINKTKEENALKIENINNEINEINKKIESLSITNYTEEELNNISKKIEEQKNILNNFENEISIIDGSVLNVYDKKYIDKLKKQIEEKQNILEKIEKELEDNNYILKHYEYLGECFSNKSGGFKKYFIGEMIEFFNTKINQFLPFFFSEDVDITFDKDLNDTIIMDGFEIDFGSLSQGQRQRAELSVAFALFEMARVFFDNDTKLLVMDEMCNGLDRLGLKSMINLLNGFDSQLRIFIVSHNPLVEEEIDNKIKIERDENGFSIIKQ